MSSVFVTCSLFLNISFRTLFLKATTSRQVSMLVPYLFLIAKASFPKDSTDLDQILPALLYEFDEEIVI